MKAPCAECGKVRRFATVGGAKLCRFCLQRALTKLSGEAERFEEFWEVVVRKDGKIPAKQAWRTLNLDAEADKIIRYFKALRPDWQKKVTKGEREYIPHPATVLRQRRWEDEAAQQQQRKTYL